MKKVFLLAAVWVVSWSEPQGNIVPCPNSQVTKDDKGLTYLSACISVFDKPISREFNTKKEADNFASAMSMLGANGVKIQSRK